MVNRWHLCWIAVLTIVTLTSRAEQRPRPFTHAPRSVRSRPVDQQHIRLELELDWQHQTIHGRAIHRVVPFKAIDELALDAAEMKVERVERQAEGGLAVPLKFESRKAQLVITLDRRQPAGQPLELAIDYTISRPRRGAHFVVPDKRRPDGVPMFWTQSEPEQAHWWFPCIDTPADRLTSEILVTVPSSYVVLSNGVLRQKEPRGDGRQRWHWVQQPSHVPYLMSVVAGQFEAYRQHYGDIEVVSYVPKGRLAEAARSFAKTPQMMQLFSEKTGCPYPWSKYAQICVDEYAWGGMEHTSATTLTSRTLHDERAHLDVNSDDLVAHELAHQWFGDLMTCKDWAELWLNESFATYMATVWTEHDLGWDEATWQRAEEARSYLREAERYRRPIVSWRYNQPGDMFDRHSYPKGARVLHMLRFELGDELFWKAIRRYVANNRLRVVETADLRTAVEEATGQGLNWFFDQWIYHPGHPEFAVSWQWDGRNKQVAVTVRQLQEEEGVPRVFRTSAEIELATASQTLLRRLHMTRREQTWHWELPARPTRVCFDPHDWILKTLESDKSKEELLDQLAHDGHVMCRIRAADQLAELVGDGDAQNALALAARNDRFWAVRRAAVAALEKFKGQTVRQLLIEVAQQDARCHVRRRAIQALGRFAHPESRKALRAIIDHDPSYYAVAEALRSLCRIDRAHCADDLLAALERPSHQDVILQAACDGLVKLKEPRAAGPLRAALAAAVDPHRRVVLIGALARLLPDDAELAQLLRQQLSSPRRTVRQKAIEALAQVGGPEAEQALLAHRQQEVYPRLLPSIDAAIDQIRERLSRDNRLRRQLEALRRQQSELEQRVEKLENAKR